MRWRHPTFGLLYPDDFMPLAERIGTDPALTRAVHRAGHGRARRLDELGHAADERQHLAVRPARREAPCASSHETLARAPLPAERLTLEMTETSIGAGPGALEAVDRAACACSVRAISIDDFGVGYSSMSQLLAAAPSTSSRSTSPSSSRSSTDRRARAVISAAIELARALELTVVAEGIETEQSLQVRPEPRRRHRPGLLHRAPAHVGTARRLPDPVMAGEHRPRRSATQRADGRRASSAAAGSQSGGRTDAREHGEGASTLTRRAADGAHLSIAVIVSPSRRGGPSAARGSRRTAR